MFGDNQPIHLRLASADFAYNIFIILNILKNLASPDLAEDLEQILADCNGRDYLYSMLCVMEIAREETVEKVRLGGWLPLGISRVGYVTESHLFLSQRNCVPCPTQWDPRTRGGGWGVTAQPLYATSPPRF